MHRSQLQLFARWLQRKTQAPEVNHARTPSPTRACTATKPLLPGLQRGTTAAHLREEAEDRKHVCKPFIFINALPFTTGYREVMRVMPSKRDFPKDTP